MKLLDSGDAEHQPRLTSMEAPLSDYIMESEHKTDEEEEEEDLSDLVLKQSQLPPRQHEFTFKKYQEKRIDTLSSSERVIIEERKEESLTS